MKVLLSIKPKFVESIIKGNKKYEYRKAIFKKNVDTVVIYKTTPFCKIIGEFEIDGILYDTPENIWQITQEFAGITQDYFDKYFYNRKKDKKVDFKYYEYTDKIYNYLIEKISEPQVIEGRHIYEYMNPNFLKGKIIIKRTSLVHAYKRAFKRDVRNEIKRYKKGEIKWKN